MYVGSISRNKSTIFSAFLLFFICLFSNNNTQAQSGCIVYFGGGVYASVINTTPASGTTTCNGYTVQRYSATPTALIPVTCRVVPPSPDSYRQCIVGSSCGVLVQNYLTCPIDGIIYLIFLPIAIIGFFIIRKSVYPVLSVIS